MTSPDQVTWSDYDAVLFDLDGVITPTAEVHMAAWSDMFTAFLQAYDGEGDTSPYTRQDYFDHVDGKPRYDGVRDFLAGRGIDLPEGNPDDPADQPAGEVTVKGLGNRKNDAFNTVLERDGIEAYPGSLRLLDHLRELGTPLAVVSSSANAPRVLEIAGLSDRFATVVDGKVADQDELKGKPAPDTFLDAAKRLGVTAAQAVVLEDAVSGVRAGRAGDFGLVIGVDRGAGEQALTAGGADLVVDDLADLVPQGLVS